jgi:hypothetical protein
MSIMDQYNGDPAYAHLHVITREFPLARTMLKQASFEENKSKIDALPDSAFAWEEERRFPVHTREDLIASIFYRNKLGSAVPAHVDEKLSLAVSVYKIEPSVFSREKQASTHVEEEYALPQEKRLPLNGPTQIKVAEEVLHRDGEMLNLERRAEAYSRLYKAAQKFDVTLTPFSLKMAGVTVCNPSKLRDWLEARSVAATENLHKEAFSKLASATKALPTVLTDRKELVKLASTIAQLDKVAGLDKLYDRKLPDPLLTVFNTEKTAEETCDVGGVQVPCPALMSLPPEVWEQIDAPELAEIAQSGDPVQFKQVFDTLPLDAKMALQAHVAG